jgi:hypothetical protein
MREADRTQKGSEGTTRQEEEDGAKRRCVPDAQFLSARIWMDGKFGWMESLDAKLLETLFFYQNFMDGELK